MPVPEENFPATQLEHAGEATAEAYIPGKHAMHCDESLMPIPL